MLRCLDCGAQFANRKDRENDAYCPTCFSARVTRADES